MDVEFSSSRARPISSESCVSQSVGCAVAHILLVARNASSALRCRKWLGAGGGIIDSAQESSRRWLGTTSAGLRVVNHQHRLQLRGRLLIFALTLSLGPEGARVPGARKAVGRRLSQMRLASSHRTVRRWRGPAAGAVGNLRSIQRGHIKSRISRSLDLLNEEASHR
ncbi:hypothetical protein HPB51_007407 [Rhipicephalus microplus]|uniref:Uncharacterized protein n=1 Tax=Rhipicephalus microplus TaxID=6941 RepID=A0A9J6EYW6_RHIMP|nr:hypothetical protein HPB51_007407 [Rhipicephalus microplus]